MAAGSSIQGFLQEGRRKTNDQADSSNWMDTGWDGLKRPAIFLKLDRPSSLTCLISHHDNHIHVTMLSVCVMVLSPPLSNHTFLPMYCTFTPSQNAHHHNMHTITKCTPSQQAHHHKMHPITTSTPSQHTHHHNKHTITTYTRTSHNNPHYHKTLTCKTCAVFIASLIQWTHLTPNVLYHHMHPFS